MRLLRSTLAASLLLYSVLPASAAAADGAGGTSAAAVADDGLHDFDFQLGNWRVRHRVKRADGSWLEFDGTCSNRRLMEGAANVEENTFHKPDGVARGVALRAYDASTGLWAIWWIDSRNPHAALDPPVKGRFEHGVGSFYSDGEIGGKAVRTRFVWSQITPVSARWEQAYSFDAGKSWETNWIMQFRREPAGISSSPDTPSVAGDG